MRSDPCLEAFHRVFFLWNEHEPRYERESKKETHFRAEKESERERWFSVRPRPWALLYLYVSAGLHSILALGVRQRARPRPGHARQLEEGGEREGKGSA